MKNIEGITIEPEEIGTMKAVSIWNCITKAFEDDNHSANNLLLAAMYYFTKFQNIDTKKVIKMHQRFMYNRIYKLEENGYPFADSEKNAIECLRQKIKRMAEISGQNETICFEILNSFLIDMLLQKKWLVLEAN